MGFYELFELCEYLGCDPLPVLSVGIPCEYQGGSRGDAVPMYKDDGVTYTDEFKEYIDDAQSYCTPNYYTQSMYSNNNGTYTLDADAQSDYKIYYTQSYDVASGDVIVKISNPHDYEQRVKLTLDDSFEPTGKMSVEILTGENPGDSNSIENPDNIKPEKTEEDFTNGMDYELTPLTFAVIRIHTSGAKLMNLTEFSNTNGTLSYTLTPGGGFSRDEYDVYAAVYAEDGALKKVYKNSLSGEMPIDDSEKYELKVMVWEKDKMKPADGYEVITAGTYTINGTVQTKEYAANFIPDRADPCIFKYNNKYYFAATRDNGGQTVLNIREADTIDGIAAADDHALLSGSNLIWAPEIHDIDGRLYMTVATNGTDTSYGIKLLTLKAGGNPLNAEDWIIKGYPILSTAMNTAEPGPGHSSFTLDENGDPVLVYHWGRSGSGRTTTVKNVHFNAKGEPVLNIPRGEQVKDEYKNVTVKVVVK